MPNPPLLPATGRSIAWRLSAGIGLYVVLASFGLLAVFQRLAVRQEEEMFIELTRSNTAFLRSSQLPRSKEMEARLGAVIGAEVRFSVGAVTLSGVVRREAGLMTVSYSLDNSQAVTFTRASDGRWAFLRHGRTWVALGVLWLSALALGAWLARGLTLPLRSLIAVLPQVGEDKPLPPLPTERADEIGALALVLGRTHSSLLEERERRRAAERLAILGRMAASLAHEVRNPVAAIRLHAQLLDGAPEDQAEASRALIATEAERIESLVRQWMHFARPEPPKLVKADLGAVSQEACARVAAQAKHARVDLRCKALPAAAAMMDRERMGQAITNLLLNAIQAQPQGGTVDVAIHTLNGQHELWVDDAGAGFSAEALAQVGRPFFSEKEGGMGLGLAAASEVARAHGGAVRVENLSPQGARVVLTLPKV